MEKLTGQQALEAEIKTIDTLLERGVRVELPAPRLLRWLGKRTLSFTVRVQDSETILRISALYLDMRRKATLLEAGTLDEAHRMVVECMVPASRIVAYGVYPYVTPCGIRNRILARYLRRNLGVRKMTELWVMVAGLSGVHDFPNFIRSLSGMRLTMPMTD